MSDPKWHPQKQDNRYTIKSLRLDLPAAIAGKTWELLPKGFRDCSNGVSYPLPGRRGELQKIAIIPIPEHITKRDCGCLYIRRAMAEWRKKQAKAQNSLLNVGRRESQIRRSHDNYTAQIKVCKQEARDAVKEVQAEAAKAVASLTDLFSLRREGINKQMKAYLAGEEYQGETINARAFRECFRIVTQAVKGLGLPSDQRPIAAGAVMEEAAAALKATRETVALASHANDPETEH